MAYDAYWTGTVSDISSKNGTSQNGTPWTLTHFKFSKVTATKNGNMTFSYWMDSFANIQLVEGGIYLLGIDLRNEKGQDGKYNLKLYAQMAEPLNVPQGNQPPQGQGQYQQAPQQYQQNYQQAPQNNNGYNNSYNGGYNNGYQQPQQYQQYAQQRPPVNMNNGPENFKDDDIPF